MNLHKIVRGAISSVTADETVTVWRSKSRTEHEFETDEEGNQILSYEAIRDQRAQIQPESDSALYFSGNVAQNSVTRRCYLFADKPMDKRTFTNYRPLARSGDYIERRDGTAWLVTAVMDDYGAEGWVSVRMTLQDIRPVFMDRVEVLE